LIIDSGFRRIIFERQKQRRFAFTLAAMFTAHGSLSKEDS
jgi:hypothetical protein